MHCKIKLFYIQPGWNFLVTTNWTKNNLQSKCDGPKDTLRILTHSKVQQLMVFAVHHLHHIYKTYEQQVFLYGYVGTSGPPTGPTGVCSSHANEPLWSVIELLLVNVGPFRALTWGACLKYRMGRKIWKHKNPSVQQLGLFFKLFFLELCFLTPYFHSAVTQVSKLSCSTSLSLHFTFGDS